MEYFMKHLLGTQNSVLGGDLRSLGEQLPKEVKWHETGNPKVNWTCW
jgi:nitrate reductase alpha subunit